MLDPHRRRLLKLAGGTLVAGGLVAVGRPIWADQRPGLAEAGQPLPALGQLPLQRFGGVASATLVASTAPARLAGLPVTTMLYHGQLPGPLIRLREGEHVRLTFRNQLEVPSNLHLHGLHTSPAADAPFTHLMPGEAHVYEFTVPNGSAGTYWYHPHLHGQIAPQLFAGLAGPLVIEGGADALPELRAAEEQVLVLKDYSVRHGQVRGHSLLDANGKQGSLLTVNGAWRPLLRAQRRTLRLRLINASTARYFRLSLGGLPLHLIATDGGFIGRPVPLSDLLLAPGERAEVLVQLPKDGTFELSDLGYQSEGGTGPAQLLMRLQVPERGPLLPLPTHLADVEQLDTQASRVQQVTLNQSFPLNFGMNGRAFDMNRVDLQARQGTVELWDLVSRSDAAHPFHLHSYPFQVLSRGGRLEPFRAWRDVVNVPSGQTVRIAVPFRDFAGTTVYHCHIAEHEDHGMMGVVQVLPQKG
ncbi:MAG: multicopper oxidase family protein [Deinococcus sp.]